MMLNYRWGMNPKTSKALHSLCPPSVFESNWQRGEKNEGNVRDKAAVSDPQLGATTHRDYLRGY